MPFVSKKHNFIKNLNIVFFPGSAFERYQSCFVITFPFYVFGDAGNPRRQKFT